MHATLLDEGTYVCSPRTMYRLLDGAGEIKERRDQVRRPHDAAPQLLATRPNEVWSWDITKLLGPAKWTYFNDHCHSGLGFLTPAVVYGGQAATVRDHRRHVLTAACLAHPERFVKGRPRPADLPQAVWINPPAKDTTAQDVPGTTIVISDDCRSTQIHDADEVSFDTGRPK